MLAKLLLLSFFLYSCKYSANLTSPETIVDERQQELFDSKGSLLYALYDPFDASRLQGVLFYTERQTDMHLSQPLSSRGLKIHVSTKDVETGVAQRKSDMDEQRDIEVVKNHLEGVESVENLRRQRVDNKPNITSSSVFKSGADIPTGYHAAEASRRALALASAASFLTLLPLSIFVDEVPLVPMLALIGGFFGGSVALGKANYKIYKHTEDKKERLYFKIEETERVYLMEKLGEEDYGKIRDLRKKPYRVQIEKVKEIFNAKGYDTSSLGS